MYVTAMPFFYQTHNAYRTRARHILDECKCYLGAELFCKMPGAIVTVIKKINNHVICAMPLRPRHFSDEFDVYLVAELYHTNRAVCGSVLDFYKRDFQQIVKDKPKPTINSTIVIYIRNYLKSILSGNVDIFFVIHNFWKGLRTLIMQ